MSLSRNKEHLVDLVGELYDVAASSKAERWLEFIKKLNELLPLGHSTVYHYQLEPCKINVVANTSDSKYIDEYENRYYKTSPMAAAFSNATSGDIIIRNQIISDAEITETDIYKNLLLPQNIFHEVHLIAIKKEHALAGISFTRPKDMRDFNSEELSLFRYLMPHLQKAFRLQSKLFQLEKERDSMREALDKLPRGVIIVDDKGCAVFINKSARTILNKNDGLTLDKRGQVLAHQVQDSSTLHSIIKNIFAPDSNHELNFTNTVNLPRPSGLRPFSVFVAPSYTNYVGLESSTPAAILFIHDPEEDIETAEKILCKVYELTPTEAKLTAILVQGNSLTEVASNMGITQNTARTHIKHIFQKTGTKRQSDLIKLILNGPARLK